MDILNTRTRQTGQTATTQATFKVSDVVQVHIPHEQTAHIRSKSEKAVQDRNYTGPVLPSYPFNPRAFFEMVSDITIKPLILFPKIKKSESKPNKNPLQKISPSDSENSQITKNHFQYTVEGEDTFYDKLDKSWNEIVIWFYEESDKNSQVLLRSYRDYIITKKLEVFKASRLFKKAGSRQQLDILELLNNELEEASMKLEQKYMLGAELNKLYHDDSLSLIHKLALVNVIKAFGRFYVLQREKLVTAHTEEQNRLTKTNYQQPNQSNVAPSDTTARPWSKNDSSQYSTGKEEIHIDFELLEAKLDETWDKIYFWLRENPVNTMHGFENKLAWFLSRTLDRLSDVYATNPIQKTLEQLHLIRQIKYQLENEVEYVTSPNFGFWLNAIYHSSSLSIFQRLIFVDIWRNFFQQLAQNNRS